MSDSLAVLKSVMDIYQAQYSATDKLWGYFSPVTLALVAYTISSDKVFESFPRRWPRSVRTSPSVWATSAPSASSENAVPPCGCQLKHHCLVRARG
jgi:hypothetical protein